MRRDKLKKVCFYINLHILVFLSLLYSGSANQKTINFRPFEHVKPVMKLFHVLSLFSEKTWICHPIHPEIRNRNRILKVKYD
jgi:hypothetical protein